jgi:phosphoglucosamine mutase
LPRKIFGTDGVRGLANHFPIEPETALALGRAIAHIFMGKGGKHFRFVIGKDTRRSGYMIENALSAGICSRGGEAIFLGPLPTPGIAFITQAMRADAGVVISASHNPYFDNGIKFFDHQGYKLPDEIEERMEEFLELGALRDGPTHEQVGKAYRVDDAPGRYIEHLKSKFPADIDLEGLKVVVDTAHGAAYKVAPIVFEELGAEVISIGNEPNGFNINENCGALYPQALQVKVREVGADIGIALDGDADRLLVCDERGEIVHGDSLIAICGQELIDRGQLAKNTIVITVMSNLGLENALKARGIQVKRVQVGDRYLIEAMRQGEYNFGGEQSGHLIFRDYSTTGDGILAGLQVLALMVKNQMPLSKMAHELEILPQVLLNVRVQQKKDLNEVPGLIKLENRIRKTLGEGGRTLLRFSGTEPVLRIMLEGEDLDKIQGYAQDLKQEAERALGKG